jgi:hypothetical protein
MSTPRFNGAFKGKEGAAVTATTTVICDELKARLKSGDVKAEDISILDIAHATLGAEGVLAMMKDSDNRGSLERLREEVDPVYLTAFNQITELLVLQGVVEGYNKPEFIGDKLVSHETSKDDNTREPGIDAIGDDAMVVPEGEEYPDVKFGQDWIDIPRSVKRGMKIGLTREMVHFDRTGKVLEAAREVGYRVAISKEKRILSTVLGVTNNFVRKGVARNTYVLTGGGDPRVNALASNPLVDWTDVDAVNQLFVGMVDDRTPTPEPISVVPDTILVSPSRLMVAKQILNATQVRESTNTAARNTYAGNPLTALPLNIVSSVWFDWVLINLGGVSAANAREYWYMGEFKRAFMYRTIFPLNVRSAPANNPAEFERDVIAQFRADERGTPYIRAPWLVAKSYNVA